jgi:hypothetical protein
MVLPGGQGFPGGHGSSCMGKSRFGLWPCQNTDHKVAACSRMASLHFHPVGVIGDKAIVRWFQP